MTAIAVRDLAEAPDRIGSLLQLIGSNSRRLTNLNHRLLIGATVLRDSRETLQRLLRSRQTMVARRSGTFDLRVVAAVQGSAPVGDLLECRVEEAMGVSWLIVRGEVDISTVPLLSNSLGHLSEQGRDMVVVMNEVLYLDMAGIRVLEEFHRKAEESGRRFILASPSPIVRRVLEIVGVDGIPVVVSTRTAALSHLQKS